METAHDGDSKFDDRKNTETTSKPLTDEVDGFQRALDAVEATRLARLNETLRNEFAGKTYSAVQFTLDAPFTATDSMVSDASWSIVKMHLVNIVTAFLVYPGTHALEALGFVGSESDTAEAWRQIVLDACKRAARSESRETMLAQMRESISRLEDKLRAIARTHESLSPIRPLPDFSQRTSGSSGPYIDTGFRSFLKGLLAAFKVYEVPSSIGFSIPVYEWAPPVASDGSSPRKRRIDRHEKPFHRLHEFQQFTIQHLLTVRRQMTLSELVPDYKKSTLLDISPSTAKALLTEISSGPKGAGFLCAPGRTGYQVVKLPLESNDTLQKSFDARPKHWIANLTDGAAASRNPGPSADPAAPKN